MNDNDQFQTLATIDLDRVTGGAGFWSDLRDAGAGALNMVSSPVGAVYRGARGTVGALQQGHSVSDSLANGLVQAAGTMQAPDLSRIPAR